MFSFSHFEYYVVPSWLDCGIRWSQFESALADPVASGLMSPTIVQHLVATNSFPPAGAPFEVMHGPFGGGMIRIDRSNDPNPGYFFLTFSGYTETSWPPGSARGGVCLVDARGDASLRLGRRVYRGHCCQVSFEHVNAVNEKLYFVVDHSRLTDQEELSFMIEQCGGAFGVSVKPLNDVPAGVSEEVAPWYPNERRVQSWYQVHGESSDLGLYYGALVYAACESRQNRRRGIHSMNLMAQLDPPSNSRKNWRTLR